MSNSTVIGTTSSFYGVATFQSQPIITSTILANNDNSTNIATTAWANSFLTYAQTQPNTWTGAQTFTTANVSVLNVFKTSVDTINASSITSDMTIGANLNGGSLTIGSANSTVNVSGNTINIGAPSNIINVGAQVNRTGLISIGSNSASTTSTGGLNLGSVSSGTGSVQLANGTSQTANIIIGNGNAVVTGSDKIIIGKSGKTVSISGATTLDNGTLHLSNATINVNSPLTVGYNPSTLIAGQIGYTYSPTVTWTNFGDSLIASQSLPAGVYMVSWNIQTVGAFINNFLYIFGLTLPTDQLRWAFAPTGLTNTNVCSGSIVSSITATSTLQMKNFAANSQTGGGALNMLLYITRIA